MIAGIVGHGDLFILGGALVAVRVVASRLLRLRRRHQSDRSHPDLGERPTPAEQPPMIAAGEGTAVEGCDRRLASFEASEPSRPTSIPPAVAHGGSRRAPRRWASGGAVVVADISKRYGEVRALDGVSFEVAPRSVVALLGPNGAGKTTCIEILEGLLRPSEGTVRVLGEDPWRAGRAWRARIGVVPQSTALDPQLSVAEEIAAFAASYPDPYGVGELLEIVDLVQEASTRTGMLSGGQRRRLDVALGLIGRPDLLFLDEPTTGFDPAARRETWAAIENLTATGMTVLLTTHYLDEADHLADRVVVLAEGHVVADSTPSEMRAATGGSTIRYRLPAGVRPGDVPDQLAPFLLPDRQTLVVRSDDLCAMLETLVAWARIRRLDLNGLEVGPPSLEDAYLALTDAEPSSAAANRSTPTSGRGDAR